MIYLIQRGIRFFCFFIIFFILGNVFYTLLLVSTDLNVKKRIQLLTMDDRSYEVIVLGASTMFDAFDPDVYNLAGRKSYNFAIDGNSVKGNLLVFNEYLKRCTVKPSLVILGQNANLEQHFDDEVINPIVELTSSNYNYTISDAPIIRLKWLGFEAIKKILSKERRKAYLHQGQLRTMVTNPDCTVYKEKSLDVNQYRSSFWISQLAQLCDTKGIKFVLVEMPGFKVTQNNSRIGPILINFEHGSKALLYNLANNEYCSLYDSGRDWVGNSHLNALGAKKFTKSLYEIMNNKGNCSLKN